MKKIISICIIAICIMAQNSFAQTEQDLQNSLNIRIGNAFAQKAEIDDLIKVLMGEQAGITKAGNYWKTHVKELEAKIEQLKQEVENEMADTTDDIADNGLQPSKDNRGKQDNIK